MSIEIERLVIRYGKTIAVDDLSFSICDGERFALLGPNGAGKTSTIHAIAGLIKPASGRVSISGTDRTIGLAPQEIALYPPLSVAENLRFFGALNRLYGSTLRSRVDDVIEIVQLTAHRNTQVSRLSGGMARRLNFAVAILHSPRVLLLDEPTLGVDTQSRDLLLAFLRHNLPDTTIIYSTHYMEEVEKICRRVAIIDAGQLIACGGIAELIEERSRPVLEVTVEGNVTKDSLGLLIAEADASGRRFRVHVEDVGSGLARLATWAVSEKLTLLDVQVVAGTLESVFLDLTGRRLRDEAEASIWYS